MFKPVPKTAGWMANRADCYQTDPFGAVWYISLHHWLRLSTNLAILGDWGVMPYKNLSCVLCTCMYKKCVPKVTVWHHEALPLCTQNTCDRIFFLHTYLSVISSVCWSLSLILNAILPLKHNKVDIFHLESCHHSSKSNDVSLATEFDMWCPIPPRRWSTTHEIFPFYLTPSLGYGE